MVSIAARVLSTKRAFGVTFYTFEFEGFDKGAGVFTVPYARSYIRLTITVESLGAPSLLTVKFPVVTSLVAYNV